LNCNVLTPSLPHFSTRTCGLEWFTRNFPAQNVQHEEETNDIWKAYLTPMMLSSRALPIPQQILMEFMAISQI